MLSHGRGSASRSRDTDIFSESTCSRAGARPQAASTGRRNQSAIESSTRGARRGRDAVMRMVIISLLLAPCAHVQLARNHYKRISLSVVGLFIIGWLHVQFAQNCNKRIAFCRRHCFAPLFAACLTARRVKVGFVHCHDCSGCTNPTGVVGLQSDGE